MSATRAIQTAIYGVLSADATLAGLSLTSGTQTVYVYNDVPSNAGYPHVLIAKATEMPWHTFGGPHVGIGWSDIIRLHTYSRYQGDYEAERIDERILTLLNFLPLSVSGFGSAVVECKQGRMLVEAIDKIETRHLVREVHVMVQ